MKRAPIHQFIKVLKAREAAQEREGGPIAVKVSTPSLDLSQIPPDWKAGVQPFRELALRAPEDCDLSQDLVEAQEVARMIVPHGWIKGQLLNVRNRGVDYCVTLFPEEFDPRSPNRAILFTNTADCQNFVSKWYAREIVDPRAY